MAWLVWLKSQKGPVPQVWHDWDTAKGHYHANQPRGQMHDLYIERFELKPGEEREPIDVLEARYPCPKGI